MTVDIGKKLDLTKRALFLNCAYFDFKLRVGYFKKCALLKQTYTFHCINVPL